MNFYFSLNIQKDKHERWWIEYNGYHERRTKLLHSWSRSRHELLIKSKALLADAWLDNESIKAKEMAIKQQDQLCQELHQKVNNSTTRAYIFSFCLYRIIVSHNLTISLLNTSIYSLYNLCCYNYT